MNIEGEGGGEWGIEQKRSTDKARRTRREGRREAIKSKAEKRNEKKKRGVTTKCVVPTSSHFCPRSPSQASCSEDHP